MAKEALPGTRVVLGLRDILDHRAVVRALWQEQDIYQLLESSYDQILVYGCRHLYDVTQEYAFSPILRERTVFTGYIAKDARLEADEAIPQGWTSDDRKLLVMGGGGGDAADLFHAFLDAWPGVRTAAVARALLVTGPLMDAHLRTALRERAARLTGIELLDFSCSILRLVPRADLVISMGGYNSVVEVITARIPLVVCPRVRPRKEQLIRSRILEQLGLAHMVRLDHGGSQKLAQAVVSGLRDCAPEPAAWSAIDLDGAARVAEELLGSGVAARAVASAIS
jgi:predicted glycosyltransferase